MSHGSLPCTVMLLIFCLPLMVYSLPTSSDARPRAVEDGSAAGVLIGDLVDSITTATGRSVANILQGLESGQSDASVDRPNGQACKNEPCCEWFDVSRTLTERFLEKDGRCNDLARASIRLGFHDAGTWSHKLKDQGMDFGGADGSILMDFGEQDRPENNGLQEIISELRQVQKQHKVGFADLAQYAANHATVTCPLGPRVRTFIGREDAVRAAPDNLLPSMKSPASDLIALFEDKTISPHSLAALVGAHSTSRQFTQMGAPVGAPQDSTPGVWDVLFYNETIQSDPPSDIFRFDSDIALANDPQIKDEWTKFVLSQDHWNEDYAASYVRMSLLGVNNINNLTECTMTLPAARPAL